MSKLIDYKCPNCGGAIAFDSQEQQMKCPFCDALFSTEALKNKDEVLKEPSEIKWKTRPEDDWGKDEQEGLSVFSCKSCGGEIMGDLSMAATTCPYCDNNVVMAGRLSGQLRPDIVLPFKVNKEQAKKALSKHLNGKFFLPKVFKDQNHLDEIKGIYVPFWLFNADADASIYYKATQSRTWSDSAYNYVETSYYRLLREGFLSFSNVPVDGSSKMADDLMESIEPYNLKDAVDFQTAYLAGYLADKYDVGVDESIGRANKRIENSTAAAFATTVKGFSNIQAESSDINIASGEVQYAFLPVWLLNTTWQGNKYVFAMNGQTEKFVGDLPIDKGAYWRMFFILTLILGFVFFGLQWLLLQI